MAPDCLQQAHRLCFAGEPGLRSRERLLLQELGFSELFAAPAQRIISNRYAADGTLVNESRLFFFFLASLFWLSDIWIPGSAKERLDHDRWKNE